MEELGVVEVGVHAAGVDVLGEELPGLGGRVGACEDLVPAEGQRTERGGDQVDRSSQWTRWT